MDEKITVRGAKPPFCWQYKGNLRAIRKAARQGFITKAQMKNCLLVYLGITEYCSDNHYGAHFGSGSFVSIISSYTGLSRESASKTLTLMNANGFLRYEQVRDEQGHFAGVEIELVTIEEVDTRYDEPKAQHGFVYFIHSAKSELTKIGKSINPVGRFNDLNRMPDVELQFVFAIESEDSFGLESSLHKRFGNVRKEGEWFALSNADLSEIRSEFRILDLDSCAERISAIEQDRTRKRETPFTDNRDAGNTVHGDFDTIEESTNHIEESLNSEEASPNGDEGLQPSNSNGKFSKWRHDAMAAFKELFPQLKDYRFVETKLKKAGVNSMANVIGCFLFGKKGCKILSKDEASQLFNSMKQAGEFAVPPETFDGAMAYYKWRIPAVVDARMRGEKIGFSDPISGEPNGVAEGTESN